MPHFLLRQNTNDTSDQINQTEANYNIILIQVQLPNLFVVHLILGSSVIFCELKTMSHILKLKLRVV